MPIVNQFTCMKYNLFSIAQFPAPLRVGCFICGLLILWAPFAIPIRLSIKDDNLVTILTMVLLYIEFLILLRLWGKHVHKQGQLFKHYGLERSPRNVVELVNGFAIGLTGILILFGLQGILGWLEWQQPKMLLTRLVLEGFIVSLFYGFAEELLFRGWLLDELQRDYSPQVSLWVNAGMFAGLHFKPMQFPALLLLGLGLVWAKRWHQGRLGLPIGYHGGLVWGMYIMNVGGLVKYTNQVPDWVTGIDRNPLQGLMALWFLLVIASWFKETQYWSKP
jgi:uncharacterized protein